MSWGCLPFTQTTGVEILCKNMTSDVMGEWPATKYIKKKEAEQTKESRKLHRVKSQSTFFEVSSKGIMGREPLIFQPEFPFFPWHLALLVFWAMRESPGTGSYHCEEEKQKRIKKRHETLSVYSSDLDFMSFSLASISTTAAFLCCIWKRSRDHRWSK